MKTVIFIGKFFPELSYESLDSYLLINELRAAGNYIILISDSWCRCSQETYLNCDNLREIVDEVYFLDPVQMYYNDYNIPMGIISLCKKITKFHNNIDLVITSNFLDYALVMDDIKKRFHLSTGLIVCNRTLFRGIGDEYMGEIALDLLKEFDKVFMQREFGRFSRSIGIEHCKIYDFDITRSNGFTNRGNYILIFGILEKRVNVALLNSFIGTISDRIKLLLWGGDISVVQQKIVSLDRLEIVKLNSMENLIELLKNAKMIIDYHYIIAAHNLDDYNQVLKKYNSNVLSDASIENLNDLVEG